MKKKEDKAKPTKWQQTIEGNGWNEWVNLICPDCGHTFEKVIGPNNYHYCPYCGKPKNYSYEW